jgi:ABC-type multidrug transport system permease subunit
VLAEIGTIITIIIVVTVYKFGVARGLPAEAYDAFGERAGGVIGIVGGTLYTYAFARLLMRRLSANFIAHGIVVAVVAITVSVLGSIAGHQGVPLGYVFASILKLLAGWFAGFQAGKPAPAT